MCISNEKCTKYQPHTHIAAPNFFPRVVNNFKRVFRGIHTSTTQQRSTRRQIKARATFCRVWDIDVSRETRESLSRQPLSIWSESCNTSVLLISDPILEVQTEIVAIINGPGTFPSDLISTTPFDLLETGNLSVWRGDGDMTYSAEYYAVVVVSCVILCVMIFGCMIISDCGRMIIWRTQLFIEGSACWAGTKVLWKGAKHQINTGCGMCPDLEIEGWENAEVPNRQTSKVTLSSSSSCWSWISAWEPLHWLPTEPHLYNKTWRCSVKWELQHTLRQVWKMMFRKNLHHRTSLSSKKSNRHYCG